MTTPTPDDFEEYSRIYGWRNTQAERPPEGVEVWTRDSNGRAQKLVYSRGYWWQPDLTERVYYVPVSWQLAD